jgi:hypothetical protein
MANSQCISSLEQNESKLMSILRDLDPQNAMIHRNTRDASKGNKIAWMLALLLLSGGATWLFLSNKPSQNLPATYSTVATTVSTNESLAATDSARDNQPPATGGTAEIRENQPAQGEQKSDKAGEQSALLAMQMEQEKTRMEQLTGSTPSTPIVKQKSAATDQRLKTANSAGKSPRNAAKRSTPDGARPTKSEKKPAERDIDIITAIVK